MIRIRVGAGRMILDKRQPHRLVARTLEVVFARCVWGQRVPGAVQQTPVGVVERFDEELALARVLSVAGRFVVDEQYLGKRQVNIWLGHLVYHMGKLHENTLKITNIEVGIRI